MVLEIKFCLQRAGIGRSCVSVLGIPALHEAKDGPRTHSLRTSHDV